MGCPLSLRPNIWGNPEAPGITVNSEAPGSPEAPGITVNPGNPEAPGTRELLTSSTDYLEDKEDSLQDEDALIMLGVWSHALGTTVLNKIKETNSEVDDSTSMCFCIGFMIMYLCFSIKDKAVTAETDPGVQFTPFIDTVD